MAEHKSVTLNIPSHLADYLEGLNSTDVDFVLRTGIHTLKESKKLAQTGGIIPVRRNRYIDTVDSARLIRRMLTINNREYKRVRPEQLRPLASNPMETLSDDFAKFTFKFDTAKPQA
jgi:hypothetical protein